MGLVLWQWLLGVVAGVPDAPRPPQFTIDSNSSDTTKFDIDVASTKDLDVVTIDITNVGPDPVRLLVTPTVPHKGRMTGVWCSGGDHWKCEAKELRPGSTIYLALIDGEPLVVSKGARRSIASPIFTCRVHEEGFDGCIDDLTFTVPMEPSDVVVAGPQPETWTGRGLRFHANGPSIFVPIVEDVVAQRVAEAFLFVLAALLGALAPAVIGQVVSSARALRRRSPTLLACSVLVASCGCFALWRSGTSADYGLLAWWVVLLLLALMVLGPDDQPSSTAPVVEVAR